jgi:hypothetical protein
MAMRGRGLGQGLRNQAMAKPGTRPDTALPVAAARPRDVIGWRETIAMPGLGIASMTAKIDTGARTSALHAEGLAPFERDGERWIGFRVPQDDGRTWVACAARIADQRSIKNTGGIAQTRYVIETALVLGRRQWTIEVSLADRTTMALSLILGRTAIRRRRVVVDPGHSFLAGPPTGRTPKAVSRPRQRGVPAPEGRRRSSQHERTKP